MTPARKQVSVSAPAPARATLAPVMAEPTHADWRALYTAAATLKQLAPWSWMADSDLFGVEEPETGEVSWCCVLGQLGQLFALAAYPGAEGLDFYRRVEGGDIDPEEAFFGQRCLMASFGDRDEIDKKDLAVIRALGLKFRGASDWPCFRSYEPGYVPWYLDRDQARRLTLVLEQSIKVATRCRTDVIMVAPDRAERYLVRTTRGGSSSFRRKPDPPGSDPPPAPKERSASGSSRPALAWRDVRRQLPRLQPRPAPPPLDTERVESLRSKVERVETTWELDVFHLPYPVADGKARPFYPRVLLLVDRMDKLVLHVELARNRSMLDLARGELLKTIHRAAAAPSAVAVTRTEIREALEPLCVALGCQLGQAAGLEALAEAKTNLIESMSRG